MCRGFTSLETAWVMFGGPIAAAGFGRGNSGDAPQHLQHYARRGAGNRLCRRHLHRSCGEAVPSTKSRAAVSSLVFLFNPCAEIRAHVSSVGLSWRLPQQGV